MAERNMRRDEGQDSVGRYLTEIGRTPLLNAEQEVEISQRIEAGLMAQHILDNPDGYDRGAEDPPAMLEQLTRLQLTREELEWLVEDGVKAKNHMLEANLRLTVSVARRYGRQMTTSMNLLDVIQEGNTGLVRAVEKFDYKKGFKFSTYATWWIRQSITRSFADHSRIVRLPVHIAEALNKIQRTQRELSSKLDREPTVDEVAEKVDMPSGKVQDILSFAKTPASLNQSIGDGDDGELGDLVANTLPESQEYAAYHETQNALSNLLDDAFVGTEQRIADIIKMRFGLLDGNVWLLDNVAEYYGFSRERARQLEKKGLQTLRAYAEKNNLTFSDFMD